MNPLKSLGFQVIRDVENPSYLSCTSLRFPDGDEGEKAWSGIEEVITAPTRNQSSILEAEQREPLEILWISGHKGFGKSLLFLLHISPISGG